MKVNTKYGEVTYESVEQLAENYASCLKALKANVQSPDLAPPSGQLVEALKHCINLFGALDQRGGIGLDWHDWIRIAKTKAEAALATHSEDRDKEMVELLEWKQAHGFSVQNEDGEWYTVHKLYPGVYTSEELVSIYRKQKSKI